MRTWSARATPPCALRRLNASLNLPTLHGAPTSGRPRLPLPFLLLLFLRLFAMRLDGEEQGRAQDEQLEGDEDYRNPIHDFLDMLHGPMKIPLRIAITVPKQASKSQTQFRQKTADQMAGVGLLPRKFP